jgi:hypothetical protein
MTARPLARLGLTLAAVTTIGAVIAAPASAAAAPFATATSQASTIDVPGVYTGATTPTTVSNDGTGSTDPTTTSVSIGNANGFVPSGPVGNYQVVQAGTDGSSLACAGVDVKLNNLLPSADGRSCADTTSGFSMTVNLTATPLLHDALLSASCPALFLGVTGMVSYAYSNAVDAPSGGATFSTLRVLACSRAGNAAVCPTGSLSVNPSANNDLLAEIISYLNGANTAGCTSLADALQAVANQVQFRSNDQRTLPDGSFQETAINYSDSGPSPSTFAFARSSVGPNTIPQVDTPMMSTTVIGGLAGLVLLATLMTVAVRRRRVVIAD